MIHSSYRLLLPLISAAVLAQDAIPLPKLQKQLQDPKAEVRRAAAMAIAKLGSDALPAASALASALTDKDAGVAESAGHALGAIGKKAIPTIRKALEKRDSALVAIGAVEKLGADGVDLVPDMLKTLRQGERVDLTQATSRAVCAIGPAAVPHLVDALKERVISSDVAMILGDMGPAAKAAVGDLIATAENRSERLGVRSCAAESLGRIGPDAAPCVARLIAVAHSDKETGVRLSALRAVGTIGVKELPDREALARLASDPNPEVAQAARSIAVK